MSKASPAISGGDLVFNGVLQHLLQRGGMLRFAALAGPRPMCNRWCAGTSCLAPQRSAAHGPLVQAVGLVGAWPGGTGTRSGLTGVRLLDEHGAGEQAGRSSRRRQVTVFVRWLSAGRGGDDTRRQSLSRTPHSLAVCCAPISTTRLCVRRCRAAPCRTATLARRVLLSSSSTRKTGAAFGSPLTLAVLHQATHHHADDEALTRSRNC